MMKYISLVIFLVFTVVTYAQPEDAIIKTIEGKEYYVHTVKQGNTLYGIHKLYNTKIEKILSANPGLDDDLVIGQQILIPISSDNQNNKKHTVQEGETLYGISKQYNCSIEELKKLNPGVEKGLSIGQELNIPSKDIEVIQTDPQPIKKNYNITYQDSIVKHVVLKHETLYSISKRYMVKKDSIMALNQMKSIKVKKGDTLLIPVKKVNYKVLEKQIEPINQEDSIHTAKESKRKEVYKIAMLLPFMFDRNDAQMNKPIKFGQVREMYPTTEISLQFYQGFMLAVDSLKKAGFDAEIYVYDTKRDTQAIAEIFKKEEFKDIDLIVGPFFQSCISYTAKKCQKDSIKLVLPFKADARVLHENPFVFKPVTSNMSLMDGAIDYIVKHHAHHNVVILKPYSKADKALYERAVERYNALMKDKKGYNSQLKTLSLGSSSGRDLNGQIPNDTTTVVIIPSNNVKFVTGAMNRLNGVMNFNPYAKKMKIIAFGFEDWNKYQDIDVLHRNRLNQHYATYRFVDYNYGQGLEMVKAFREFTGVDPNVYSTQGFDIGMYFMSALELYGVNFETFLDHHQIGLVQNIFRFEQIAPGSGYENKNVSVVRYANFELLYCPN